MNENEKMTRMIEFYYTNKIEVHITLNSNKFYNGRITKYSPTSFILDDRKFGNVIIFADEIKRIEPTKPKEF